MEPKSNCSTNKQKGEASLRERQNAYSLTLAEIISILSIILGRDLRDEEIEEIAEAPAKFENLIVKHRSLHDEVHSLKKSNAEMKLAESSLCKGKGWWDVNIDELNTVEQAQEVAARAVECKKFLAEHMTNLPHKSYGKKDT